MALKHAVDKLEDLDEALRSHYKAGSDGKFYLETDKGDVGALVRAKEHEKTLRTTAEANLATVTEQLTAATEGKTAAETARDEALRKKTGDVTALEASWQSKVDAEKQRADGLETSLTGEINRLLVSDTAQKIAAEISTVPDLIAPIIEKRLAAEKGAEGKFHTRILDAEGKPSASSLDDLKQELLANEKYAAIMVSGKGSGGGAHGSGSGGGASEKKKFLDYSDSELVVLRNSDPDTYNRLKDEANAVPVAQL